MSLIQKRWSKKGRDLEAGVGIYTTGPDLGRVIPFLSFSFGWKSVVLCVQTVQGEKVNKSAKSLFNALGLILVQCLSCRVPA